MASVNKVILIGNVGRDPEMRYSADGSAIANLSLATSEQWKDKSGEKQEKTEWHRVVFFGKLAEIISMYVKKGTSLYIEGKLQTRKWADKDGTDKYTTEVIGERMQMLGGGKEQGKERETKQETKPEGKAERGHEFDDFADDIPF